MMRRDARTSPREIRNKRVKKKAPLPFPPSAAERSYEATLARIGQSLADQLLEEIKAIYPRLLVEYQAALPPEYKRDDAVGTLDDAISKAKIDWQRDYTDAELENIAMRTGKDVSDVVDKSVRNQWKRVLGMDPIMPKSKLEQFLRFKAAENASLIKSLPDKHVATIKAGILGAVQRGERWETVADYMQEKMDLVENDARRIARDQVAKMYSAITQARHQELGIDEYEWSTSNDDRVRPAHAALDGKVFKWSDPPVTSKDGARNHPGQDFGCRCVAIPKI